MPVTLDVIRETLDAIEKMDAKDLRAITIQQPYAGALITEPRLKTIETRPRSISYRGPLLVHSGKKKYPELDPRVEHLAQQKTQPGYLDAFSDIIGVVTVVDCQPIEQLLPHISEDEKLMGDYQPGRYGYITRNPIPLFGIRCSGQLGLWTPTEETREWVCIALTVLLNGHND